MSQSIESDIVDLLPRLRRFARSLTGAEDTADDLVQTGVEKALRRLDSFAPGTRLDHWLFRILRNTWIDTIRARRNTTALEPEMTETIAGEDGRRTTEAHLALAEVRRAMDALPEDQRVILTLVCIEGLRYREAAEVLGIPDGTVMSRLSRARLALMAKLEGPRIMTPREGIAE
ncbi:MAG: sigma-70 family RNA polymerase sigma factor [Rubellimicrobium sp.]|nr:sigma-70 family RNA polymerase sigma factor [Rubellimicrobium sp.]